MIPNAIEDELEDLEDEDLEDEDLEDEDLEDEDLEDELELDVVGAAERVVHRVEEYRQAWGVLAGAFGRAPEPQQPPAIELVEVEPGVFRPKP